MPKSDLTKEIVERLYLHEMKKASDVCKELRISRTTLQIAMKEFGIQPRPKGFLTGRSIDKNGYVLVLMHEHPHCHVNGYILEHRVIMESMLGRYLLPTESVHHKNEVKGDNRPENLQLYSSLAKHLSDAHAAPLPSGEELIDLYTRLSAVQIASIYGTRHSRVLRKIQMAGGKAKSLSEARKLAWLYRKRLAQLPSIDDLPKAQGGLVSS